MHHCSASIFHLRRRHLLQIRRMKASEENILGLLRAAPLRSVDFLGRIWQYLLRRVGDGVEGLPPRETFPGVDVI